MQNLIAAGFADGVRDAVYEAAKILFYPVLVLVLACLVWVLIELGLFLYEVSLRFRFRDLEALEIRALKARDAFDRGQPRRAYRYLEENAYSVVVTNFLFALIRNYQTQRLPEKPLKLLQEYEFFTIKRLERTRILVRVGPLLGLMGTLIPLAPALQGLADGDVQKLADNLTVAFSVTALGLLIGGLAFVITIVRDRFYSQDISDLEYLLELLEGAADSLRVGRARRRRADPGDVCDEDLPDAHPLADDAVSATTDESVTGVMAPISQVAGDAACGEMAAGQAPHPFVRPLPIVPGFVPAANEISPAEAGAVGARYPDPESGHSPGVSTAESPAADDERLPGPD